MLYRFKKYKTFIATVLLAVYAFIATPVQLWHHHSNTINTASKKSYAQKVESPVFKSTPQATVANCQVCSHHYSVYSDVATIVFEAPSLILPSNKECYIFSIPLSPFLNFSNKGPPLVA